MARFHLNLFNDVDILDHEGSDYEDLARAKEAAIQGARHIMAEHVRTGHPVNLGHRIEVTDESGKVLAVVPFRELITIADGGPAVH
jgi:hypothetical protein